MNNSRISETKNKMLLDMGIDPIKCNDYQILCLPENFQHGSKDNLCDADSTIKLCKKLKQSGVRCANSYDLGIDSKTSIRQNNDIYLGLVLILDKVVLPVLITIICDWLIEKKNANNSNNIINLNNNITNITTVNNSVDSINDFNKNIIHVEIKLPNGKVIKHDDDAETLKRRLNEEYQE